MADQLEITVEGRTYGGFENATFFRTIEACSGSFSLDIADIPDWDIGPGARVQAILDGEPFVTGTIDSVKREFDKGGRKMTIEGRDLAADLVDCSAIIESCEVRDISIADLARLVASPYDVEVQVAFDAILEHSDELFPLVAINQGEGAWECLERCLRMKGLLAYSTSTGALLLTRPSSKPAIYALEEGNNIKSAEITRDTSQRYRNYLVTAQVRGEDEDYGDIAVLPAGEALDLGARELRKLVIPSEQGATRDLCQQRAQWEATTRAARGMPASAVVQGWRRPGATQAGTTRGGPLWTINELVRFSAPSLRVDEDLLIASCRYRMSKDSGRTTEIGMVRPDAFLPMPMVPVLSYEDDDDPAAGGDDGGG